MRAILWNNSFRGLRRFGDGEDDFDTGENETHATVLDNMLAWERKLYDEMKVFFMMIPSYSYRTCNIKTTVSLIIQ